MPYFNCPKCGSNQYSSFEYSHHRRVGCCACNTIMGNPYFGAKYELNLSLAWRFISGRVKDKLRIVPWV